MAEKKIDISKKKKPIALSAAKITPKKPIPQPKPAPKAEKPQKTVSVKQGGKKAEGRNADGTFAKGNKPKITENYGRPQNDFSYRAMAKIRAKKDPARVQKDLDMLDEIIDDPNSSPMERMKALENKIKLNGNYDPQETKDVTKHEMDRVYKGLSLEQINKLLEGIK